MKKRLFGLLIVLCLVLNTLLMSMMVAMGSEAQDPYNDNGVVLNKTLIPATSTSPAKIRIEAYVNGTVSVSEKHQPADIVLVLDQSGSMAETVGTGRDAPTKLSLIKTAAENFISEVAAMNDATGSMYRIAVVGFASDTGYGNNTEILTVKGNNGNYGVAYNDLDIDDYSAALVNCVSNSTVLSGAVNSLDANGATRADLGMEIAESIFNSQPAGTYNERSKLVVLITDGEPTTQRTFSTSVANSAVLTAKDMKADGTEIFSIYIGTPSNNSASFLQAVSSNYPDASAYNNRGEQKATSYYSAYSDGADIEAMLNVVANTISAMSTLNEASIVTGTISDHFMLAADADSSGLDQIEIYTSDKTSSGWADEVKFQNANVIFVDESKKTIGISGFNFAANCVTQIERNGFYGRKLVIYIPIIEDESSDIFGGYVPATVEASIYQDQTALENGDETITAGPLKSDYTISYDIKASSIAYRIDGTPLSDSVQKTVNFIGNDEIASDVFDEMIPQIPESLRNIGVDIIYQLIDIGATDLINNDRNDDVIVATLEVNASDNVDVTDPSLWSWADGHESTTIVIPAGEYSAEKVYKLVATLTSIRNSQNPENLTVYNYLNLSAVRGDIAHIVFGNIDENGMISIPSGSIGNTFSETVTEGEDSAIMTFTPNYGFKIKEIIVFTSVDEPFDTAHKIYSTIVGDEIDKIDLDGDGIEDDVEINSDGSWSFGVKNVLSSVKVYVYTTPVYYMLNTESDHGSNITDGFEYEYSATNKIEVTFNVISGYELTVLEINGVKYDLTSDEDVLALENLGFDLTKDNGRVLSGELQLSATQNNDVKISSQKNDHSVVIKYFEMNEDGTYTEISNLTSSASVQFGANIMNNIIFAHNPNDVITVSGVDYVFKNLYRGYEGDGFTVAVDGSELMPDSDVVLNAVLFEVTDTESPDTSDDLAESVILLVSVTLIGAVIIVKKRHIADS